MSLDERATRDGVFFKSPIPATPSQVLGGAVQRPVITREDLVDLLLRLNEATTLIGQALSRMGDR